MKVAVSFLKAISDTSTTIKLIDESIADYIHVDVIDGTFVENKNFEPKELYDLLKNTSKKLDVHLMVNDPKRYFDVLTRLVNVEYITFHYEVVKDVEAMAQLVKSLNRKVGISLNPSTRVEEIEAVLPFVDQVLVMGVEPGAGGQGFIPQTVEKIELLKKIKEDKNYSYLISVDGGINAVTVKNCFEVGADMLVSGSFVCESDNYNQRIELLRTNK